MHQFAESDNVTYWSHNRTYHMLLLSQKHDQNGGCHEITYNQYAYKPKKIWNKNIDERDLLSCHKWNIPIYRESQSH